MSIQMNISVMHIYRMRQMARVQHVAHEFAHETFASPSHSFHRGVGSLHSIMRFFQDRHRPTLTGTLHVMKLYTGYVAEMDLGGLYL